MKQSFFQLIKQNTTKIEFIKNENFNKSDIRLTFKHDIKVNQISDTNAEVILNFYISNKQLSEDNPFYLQIEIKGIFGWVKDTDKKLVKKLLNENAPAILLSYIRSLVSQITAFSGYPALIVPLINFTK